MLNKVADFIRRYEMIQPGDSIICAVSGGADSVALLFAMHLLRDTMDFSLAAAHFNHGLRGEESDRDEQFVCKLCDRFDIPLYVGRGEVCPGEKGLEAAARDARYAFLRTLPGKIATAHTADDNAETVLLHMIRGTGLRGLGAIAPMGDRLLRPMLNVTRSDVLAFLDEYYLTNIEDSSNSSDSFMRNRVRHYVMPLIREENPKAAESISSMALRLRQDEDFINSCMKQELPPISELRRMHPALRCRYLDRFLKQNGIPEPEQSHIALAEELVFSPKPSAKGKFPGGMVVQRQYDSLIAYSNTAELPTRRITGPCVLPLPEANLILYCERTDQLVNTKNSFSIPVGESIVVRGRMAGDAMRFAFGTKSLKKLFIDSKIPAFKRNCIPVIADDAGVLGVCGFGANLDRNTVKSEYYLIRFDILE